MTRVCVIVEGPTEESFVNNVLAPVLWPRQVYVTPIIIGPAGHKGGNPKYTRVKEDVLKQLKQDRSGYCSTMLDFYGLGNDFPGMPLPTNLQSVDKVLRIERAVKADIVAEFPDLQPRFVSCRTFNYMNTKGFCSVIRALLLPELGSRILRSISRESVNHSIPLRISTIIPTLLRPNKCCASTHRIERY